LQKSNETSLPLRRQKEVSEPGFLGFLRLPAILKTAEEIAKIVKIHIGATIF